MEAEASSHLLRGMALDELGRFDEAEKSYEAALENAPGEPQILASASAAIPGGRRACGSAGVQS